MLDDSFALDDFFALWASHGLTQRQSGVLHDTSRKLAEESRPLWLSTSSSFGGGSVIVINAFRSWQSRTVSF
jgi:hypothetical protein